MSQTISASKRGGLAVPSLLRGMIAPVKLNPCGLDLTGPFLRLEPVEARQELVWPIT